MPICGVQACEVGDMYDPTNAGNRDFYSSARHS